MRISRYTVKQKTAHRKTAFWTKKTHPSSFAGRSLIHSPKPTNGFSMCCSKLSHHSIYRSDHGSGDVSIITPRKCRRRPHPSLPRSKEQPTDVMVILTRAVDSAILLTAPNLDRSIASTALAASLPKQNSHRLFLHLELLRHMRGHGTATYFYETCNRAPTLLVSMFYNTSRFACQSHISDLCINLRDSNVQRA